MPSPRSPGKLPAIPGRTEVERVIAHAANVKHRTMLLTTYAMAPGSLLDLLDRFAPAPPG